MKRLIFILLLLPFALSADELTTPYAVCKDICSVRTRCTIPEMKSWGTRLYTACFNSCIKKPQQSISCFKFYQNSCLRLDRCLQGVEYGNYKNNGFKQ